MGKLIEKFRWLWSGRSFGNQIADSMTIPRNVFHRALALGGVPMPAVVLAEIRRRGTSVADARRVIAPIVIAGLFALLAKFGAQDSFVAAHAKLVHQFPGGVTRAAYSEAFRSLDALVRA